MDNIVFVRSVNKFCQVGKESVSEVEVTLLTWTCVYVDQGLHNYHFSLLDWFNDCARLLLRYVRVQKMFFFCTEEIIYCFLSVN